MAPHSSSLTWRIPWTEEPVGCSPWGRSELDTTERLHFHFSLSCTGEGNDNPLQCSCLENPRDGGACWAAVYGVAQSRTRLSSSSSSNLPLVELLNKQILCNSILLVIFLKTGLMCSQARNWYASWASLKVQRACTVSAARVARPIA